MLKTSSSTNLASMIVMLADYVSRIHTLLLPLVFQPKNFPSNKPTQHEITDVSSIHEFKCLKQAIQKCKEVEQVVVKLMEKEKGLVSGMMGLVNQIQYFAQASIWKKQNQTNEKILNYKFSELKESINRLNSVKFQPFIQRIGITKKQSDCIVEKSIKLQNENIELKQKLGKCQYANTLLEEKVKKLNRQNKISEIAACDDSSKRLIDRISGHIFSQQFMMKANLQVRHEIENLRRDNQRLKAELRRSKQVNMKIKQKYGIGQTNQINLIGQKKFNSFKSVSPDWSQSIMKLEREIISLRKQRIKEEKVINNIQDKLVDIQMLGQSKIKHKARWSQLRDSRDEDQTLNMFLNRKEVKNVNDGDKKSYRSDQNIDIIKGNRRIATEYEPSLPYCKSSQTVKQDATYKMKEPTQKHKWKQNEQQLKTSGYFKQPQDSSIYSHKTNKGNTRQHFRRVTEQECKTSSTLA